MKWKFNIKKELRVGFALIGVCALIGFSERRQDRQLCKNIIIEISNDHANYFMDESDVMKLLNATHSSIIGTDINRLNLRQIERALMQDRHIEDAQLFADLKGNMIAHVDLRRPIARLVRNAGPDAYVASDGTIMSVSDKYTSRVVLVSGAFAEAAYMKEHITEVSQGSEVLEMIRFINDDNFWKAQVAQLDIDRNGEIKILPQVTGQLVEFGKPTELEKKFSKLMIFYKKILPQKGWTKYERVNLKFEGQIIAE